MTALKSLVAAALLAVLLVAPTAEAAKKRGGKLVPSAVTAAKQVDGKVEISFGFEVRNAGRGSERSRNAYLALVQPGAADRKLGQLRLPRLKAGGTISREVTKPIRPPTTPGAYRAQVCVRSAKALRCARSGEDLVLTPPRSAPNRGASTSAASSRVRRAPCAA